MEREITDADRAAMVRCAVSRLGRDEMKAALTRTDDPTFQAPTSVTNALRALRKHRDPTSVVTRPQYRAALPYLAAVASDACLGRTIEVLGDHSDDPTREQLAAALEEVRKTFADLTVGVMLASVADADMPASDLCFELGAADARFGLTDFADSAHSGSSGSPAGSASDGSDPADRRASPEQREARRLKKQKDAEERRRKLEVARKAGEQVRRARKQDRSGAGSGPPGGGHSRAGGPGGSGPAGPAGSGGSAASPTGSRGASVVPRLTRRASLTPLEEEEFDRSDPWVAGIVFAWVPFDAVDPDHPDLDGKSRRCVVVAGSATHLLVRPGFSEGGMKSRDWKSVPLRHWKRAGFDQPTWIDSETLRVPRPAEGEGGPVGWLEPEDWNSLW